MFNWWRKAKKDAAAVRLEVYDHLRALLSQVTYELIRRHNITEQHPDTKDMMARTAPIIFGFEMVREGGHPSEIRDIESLTHAAAKVAHDAVNEAILKRRIDNEVLIGKLRRLSGYSVDGSRRQD